MGQFKIEVASEKKGEARKIVRLKLEQDGDGVDLVVVDEDGDIERYILAITANGEVKLFEGGSLDEDAPCDAYVEVIHQIASEEIDQCHC